MSVEAQFTYLKRVAEANNLAPNLIICSGAAYGENEYNEIFPNSQSIFVDAQAGSGIDYAWDLEEEPPKELINSCDLFISTSVLEHVKRPWKASENILKTIKKGGLIFITAPWAWEYHGFPDDYWRMSPGSLDILFEKTKLYHQLWVTHPDGVGYEKMEDIPCLTDKHFVGKNRDGIDYKIRMHPLMQVFQIRQIL